MIGNSFPLNRGLVTAIYKDRLEEDFDLISLGYKYLLEKDCQFFPYFRVYQDLCRRFKYKKPACKRVLSAMKQRGLIKLEKRGVRLI